MSGLHPQWIEKIPAKNYVDIDVLDEFDQSKLGY
jgi:hypothetical protein